MRRTKIICTIGPATEDEATIRALLKAGMNVARLNFSHGTHEQHLKVIKILRSTAAELDMPLAILQDISGPKIRIGELNKGPINLLPGDTVKLVSGSRQEAEDEIPIDTHGLMESIREKDRILLADGTMELEVTKKEAHHFLAKVIVGGILTSHKGVNLPSSSLNIPNLTEKDKKDLAFGLENEVDWVALSFVRDEADLHEARLIMEDYGYTIPLIAKIEKHEALKNIEGIIKNSDAIMIARGDLGVEIPLEQVPIIQKKLIKIANKHGKPVITATQMLKSMVESPRPTRAEATDVTTAILDGTDAIMLSEETAVGNYPVEAVKFMHKLAITSEESIDYNNYLDRDINKDKTNISQAVSHAACLLAKEVGAKLIIASTMSGSTAQQISSFRPKEPIIAFTASKKIRHRLNLVWGVTPYFVKTLKSTDQMLISVKKMIIENNMAIKGDTLVITAGVPFGVKGTTNLVSVETL